MSEPDFEERKVRMVTRHLKGAKRANQRKENLEKKKRRLGLLPENEQDAPQGEDSAWEPRIAEVARTEVKVLMPDGRLETAQLSRRLLDAGGVVVGDEVRLDVRGRVVGRGDRRTLLQRKSPGNHHKVKILAANVDIGLVALAPRTGGLSLGFLDRAATALREGGIEPIAVVTKLDLAGTDEARDKILAGLDAWCAAGNRMHAVASVTGEGIDELREAIAESVTVVIGHSGVGKSTLINALDPTASQLTQEVREEDGRGKHTTTASRLIPFLENGALVDTPGVRQLAPEVSNPAALAATIPEIGALVGQCHFTDCTHGAEPGCAVTKAAATDSTVADGLARWRRLFASLVDGG